MITMSDIKFFIQYTKENPKEAKKVIAQAVVLTATAMTVGILAVKGATTLVKQK